jgi:hypothetical protein
MLILYIIHNTFNKDGKINVEYMTNDGNKTILYDINRLYPSNTKNLKQTGLAIDVLMKWINQEDYYKEYYFHFTSGRSFIC